MTGVMWLTVYGFGVLALLAMGATALYQHAMERDDMPGLIFIAVVWPLSVALVLMAWGFLALEELLTPKENQ